MANLIGIDKGYFCLWRKLLSSNVWRELKPEHACVAIVCLCMANWEDRKWYNGRVEITIPKGSFITSLKNLAENCPAGITIQNVRTALKHLEQLKFLVNKSTNKYRIVTVCNWWAYQNPEIKANRQLTSNQQATNNNEYIIELNNNNKSKAKNPYQKYVTMCKEAALDILSSDEIPQGFYPWAGKAMKSYSPALVADVLQDIALRGKRFTDLKQLMAYATAVFRNEKAKREKEGAGLTNLCPKCGGLLERRDHIDKVKGKRREYTMLECEGCGYEQPVE